LADKHKLGTEVAVFKKYGFSLKISNSIKVKKIVLFYLTLLTISVNFKLGNFLISLADTILDLI